MQACGGVLSGNRIANNGIAYGQDRFVAGTLRQPVQRDITSGVISGVSCLPIDP